MTYIDLSHKITEDSPVYPGDPKTEIRKNATLTKDGFTDHYLSLGTHTGTHIDAPSHMLENRENLSQFPLEKFTGRGVCIKISGGKFDIKNIKTLGINKGHIVFFYTGMSEIYETPEYFSNYPAIPLAVAEYLVKEEIKIVGVDTCSVDHEGFLAHKLLLKHDILIIENLTNLSELEGKKFTVYAFPLLLPLDGSPVRVVAQAET